MEAARNMHVVAAFSIAVFLAVLGWKMGTGDTATRRAIVHATPSIPTNADFSEADSDGDGIPDWQETLLGLDPHKADSDGDGVKDSAEPKVSINSVLTATYASSTNLKPADKIGNKLISDYLYLKENNAYSAERGERIGSELSNYVTYSTSFTPYTDKDEIITYDNSTGAIERHRKSLQAALDPFLAVDAPEFVLYAQFVKDGDRSALEKLRDRAALYERVAKEVLTVPAPSDIAVVHLEIANSLSFFALVLNTMVARADDPIASLALLKTYNQSEQYVQQTFGALTAYYRDKLFAHI